MMMTGTFIEREFTMKKLLLVFSLMIFSASASAARFIHPMDFTGSEAQKREVINYIEQRVRATYCDGQLDMCQPTTLRMMEKENLRVFKKLTGAKDRGVMNEVIRTYCDGMLDMCDYTTLWMMYQENVKASNDQLTW